MARPPKAQSSVNRRNALNALALGLTPAQAAQHSGLARSTIDRYLSQPDFRADLATRHAENVGEVNRLLTARAIAAVGVLTRLMNDAPLGSTQANAARAILAESRAWRDADLEARLQALEVAAFSPDLKVVR